MTHWQLPVLMMSIPPIKDTVTDWIRKQDPSFICKQGRHELRVYGWKKEFQVSGPKKQAGISISTANKIDFKVKLIRRDSEGHCIFIKEKNPLRQYCNSKHLCSKHH